MRHIAYPFLTIDPSTVSAQKWLLHEPDGAQRDAGDHIAGWDYARSIHMERTVTLRDSFSATMLGFDDAGATLDIIVRTGTGPGSMPRRRLSLHREVMRPGKPALLSVRLEGSQLSQRLTVETSIVLARAEQPHSRLSARFPGAVLWRDQIVLRLEGETPRFPMEIVSFAERFRGQPETAAPWLLQWLPGQLHRDFGGTVRLLLNHDRKDFIDRFIAADPLTLQVTLADIIAQILAHAIRQEDLDETLADCEPSSLAGHVKVWLEMAFPGKGPASIRAILETSPGRFHSAILAMADPQIFGSNE